MSTSQNKQRDFNRLIHQTSFYPENRQKIFSDLSTNMQARLLLSLSPPIRRDIIVKMPENDFVTILDTLDLDDAADILQLLNKPKQKEILQKVSEHNRELLSQLLEFDPESAAGIMNVNYILVDINDDIAAVSKKFKIHEKRTGRPPTILVKDNDQLAGFLPGHELGFGRSHDLIKKYVKKIRSVSHSTSQDDLVEIFRSNPSTKVAVVNDAGNVVGVIFSDEVLRVMQEQEANSLYDFAGVSDEESVTDSTTRKVQSRYKWLIINLITAFMAAATVSLFEDTISKYVLLAVYMPIVAGMGGNAATQTLAVVVRGIALRQIDLSTAFKTMKHELGAGFINGLINGFLVALVVLLKDHDGKIALLLAFAMVINLLVAAIFGTLVPLLMTKFKKDPASSATIFITTATDVLGFLTFLGLATLILN